MRIIAGTYRSRPLTAPRGMDTRPTSDRLRETLFNVLAPRIEGAIFVDLYAGSGAVGIEALSRGAAQTVFVEQAPPAVQAIRKNLSTLGISGGFTLETRSVAATLKRLTESGRQADIVFADIIFLDPPYADRDEYERTLALLGGACAGLLAAEAIVIAEHEKKHTLAESYGQLQKHRVLQQGDAALSFFRIERPEVSDPHPGA
ncbi:16S rRNA (guanine(966)-N(2))-methyltransferase RsmD [Silvibacterium sp.]|uniref:16S rRNA (guanine(966)-N(2))-methyltransferase RsmD n=1 Tax=Silvibacterium sp. TaxID=1964179 RepID=UPI0039E4DFFB